MLYEQFILFSGLCLHANETNIRTLARDTRSTHAQQRARARACMCAMREFVDAV